MKKYNYGRPSRTQAYFSSTRDTPTALPGIAGSAAAAACRLRHVLGMKCTKDGLVASFTLNKLRYSCFHKVEVFGIRLGKNFGGGVPYDSLIYRFYEDIYSTSAFSQADVRPLSTLPGKCEFDVVILNLDFETSSLPRLLRYLVVVTELSYDIPEVPYFIGFYTHLTMIACGRFPFPLKILPERDLIVRLIDCSLIGAVGDQSKRLNQVSDKNGILFP